jgi:hypothetical protein
MKFVSDSTSNFEMPPGANSKKKCTPACKKKHLPAKKKTHF